MVDPVDEIIRLFETRGGRDYLGEPVSQLEHALQAAHLAVQAGAPDELIAASLLHDIGHLLGPEENPADRGVDGIHEEVGAAWLAARFGPGVTEPVRLHVPAKRYLCAADPAYQAALSEASLHSLALQGGPMNSDQLREFEENSHYRAAVALRRWDDAAKIPGLSVPGVRSYTDLLRNILLAQ
jgi:gamma-butyrobetaine dioxygenase